MIHPTMRLRAFRFIPGVLTAGCLLAAASSSLAQQDSDVLLDGVPLENAIVGRDVGVRLRGEVRFEDDYDGLIDSDVNYGRFPSQIYSTDITIFHKNRSYIGGSYSRWDNDQDLKVDRWSGKFRYPVDLEHDTFLYLQYNSDGMKDGPAYNYASVATDRQLSEDIYLYMVYRNYHMSGTPSSHQLSAYVSWKPSSLMRVGGEIAGSLAENVPGAAPWYGRVFGAIFLIPDLTSFRVEGLHYDTGTAYVSDTISAYLYQKVGSRSLLRLDYRFYMDAQNLESHAWGGKVRHYFSPAFSMHAGYRWYEHSEGTDFSGPFAGVDMLF